MDVCVKDLWNKRERCMHPSSVGELGVGGELDQLYIEAGDTVSIQKSVERASDWQEKLSWQSTFYRAASGIDTAKWSISPVRRDQNSGYCRGSQYVNLITSFV